MSTDPVTDKRIVDHSMVAAAVEKYAGFLEENWEDQSVLNCAVLLRTLRIQHQLMGDEINRLQKLLSANDTPSSFKCTECGAWHLKPEDRR